MCFFYFYLLSAILIFNVFLALIFVWYQIIKKYEILVSVTQTVVFGIVVFSISVFVGSFSEVVFNFTLLADNRYGSLQKHKKVFVIKLMEK